MDKDKYYAALDATINFIEVLLTPKPYSGEPYIGIHEIGEGTFCEYKPLLKYYLKRELGKDITNEDILRGKEIHEELYSGAEIDDIKELIFKLIFWKSIELVEVFLVTRVYGIRLVGRVDCLTINISEKGNIIIEIREGKSTSNIKYLQASSPLDLPPSWIMQALGYKLILKSLLKSLLSPLNVDYEIRVIIEVIDNKTGELVNEFPIKRIDKLLPGFEKILELLKNPTLLVPNKYKDKARHLCDVCSVKEYCNPIEKEKVINFWIENRLKRQLT